MEETDNSPDQSDDFLVSGVNHKLTLFLDHGCLTVVAEKVVFDAVFLDAVSYYVELFSGVVEEELLTDCCVGERGEEGEGEEGGEVVVHCLRV